MMWVNFILNPSIRIFWSAILTLKKLNIGRKTFAFFYPKLFRKKGFLFSIFYLLSFQFSKLKLYFEHPCWVTLYYPKISRWKSLVLENYLINFFFFVNTDVTFEKLTFEIFGTFLFKKALSFPKGFNLPDLPFKALPAETVVEIPFLPKYLRESEFFCQSDDLFLITSFNMFMLPSKIFTFYVFFWNVLFLPYSQFKAPCNHSYTKPTVKITKKRVIDNKPSAGID